MGTIFLVYIYIYVSVSRSVCLSCPKCIGGIAWPTLMLKVIFGCLKLMCDSHVILCARTALALTKKNIQLEMGNLKQAEFQRLKTEERKAEDKT